MLILRALVRNVYPTNEFTDEKTGVITPPGHKVQMEYEALVSESGEKKIVLGDFNVRNQGDAWRKAMNKVVTVPVGVFVDSITRKAVLYIPKGALPTISA